MLKMSRKSKIYKASFFTIMVAVFCYSLAAKTPNEAAVPSGAAPAFAMI